MIFTHHGWQRWNERCSHLHLDTELDGAKRPSKKIRALIHYACHRQGNDGQTRSYLLTPGGAVLVVDEDKVVTAFTLRDAKRRGRLRRRGLRKQYNPHAE